MENNKEQYSCCGREDGCFSGCESLLIEVPFLPVTAEKLLRFLGTGGARTRAWGAIAAAAGRLQERMAPALAALACLTVVPVREVGSRRLKLAGFYLSCNTRFFRGADRAAVVVVTLGEEAEEEERRLFQAGEGLDALVLNALGTAALELGFQVVREEIRRQQPEGVRMGYNLGPGCQGIPMETQEHILNLAGAEKIGVKINEYHVMRPAKSTSGIIPLGRELAYPGETGDACGICGMGSRCAYRQA